VSKIAGGTTLSSIDSNATWSGTTKYVTIFRMVNTSPTINSLLNAIKDPIRTAIWKVNPNGAEQKVVD